MPFTAGRQKTGGRTKGVTNKVTDQIKKGFEQLVANNLEGLQADLDEMNPRDKVQALTSLSKYILPTLKSSEVEMNANVNQSGIDEETLDKIVNGLDL